MSSLKERFLAMERRERIMLIVLGAFLLIAIVYALFAFGGGGGNQATPFPTGSPVVIPTASPSPTVAPFVPGGFGGKDPFEPLVRPASSGGPVPSGSPSPGPSGGPSGGGGGGGGGGTSGKSTRVVLRDIFRKNGRLWATVEVNGKDFTVQPGDTFDDNFQLISLTNSCGDFAFGDSRFSLCLGQEVRK